MAVYPSRVEQWIVLNRELGGPMQIVYNTPAHYHQTMVRTDDALHAGTWSLCGWFLCARGMAALLGMSFSHWVYIVILPIALLLCIVIVLKGAQRIIEGARPRAKHPSYYELVSDPRFSVLRGLLFDFETITREHFQEARGEWQRYFITPPEAMLERYGDVLDLAEKVRESLERDGPLGSVDMEEVFPGPVSL